MGKLGFGLAVSCAVASCAIAAIIVSKRVKSRRKWNRMVGVLRELEEGCSTSLGRLRQVVDAMAVEMHAGLASEGGSKLKMLLTFIDHLPDGNEKGTYYALDLGGTNFRVLRVQLGGRGSGILGHEVQKQPIPLHLITSTSEELFDFIALTLKQFVEGEDNGSELQQNERRELGFTFSFPVRQISASSGILIKWTKGFSIEDLVGKDVTTCLQESMAKIELDMRVAALVNDTVGTLALGHYHDEDTVAAVIIGTGTNACYVERTDAIIKSQGLLTNSGGMVVNMEWGNFWSSHLPKTSYDIDLDAESPNPYDQARGQIFGCLFAGFEKMISGMYLGDIVRRVILRMAQESDIFGDVASSLSVPFILRTPLMSAMHEDDSPDLREVARILKDTLQISDVPLKVRRLIVRICDVVTHRAARLAAAGIVGILKKIGRDGSGGISSGRMKSGIESSSKMRRTVVAIEGGLYSSYTMFREYLKEAIVEILGEEIAQHVILRVSEDGSGIGAALLAASHSSSSSDLNPSSSSDEIFVELPVASARPKQRSVPTEHLGDDLGANFYEDDLLIVKTQDKKSTLITRNMCNTIVHGPSLYNTHKVVNSALVPGQAGLGLIKKTLFFFKSGARRKETEEQEIGT
ncbi:Hexokinase [Macleaya cordata]|uniref:Phosphotransferase n=1 Tax=Macleaya cordata TaxID=56857 RepID=A0A200QMF7_MACCD|nr:Hexokinase [Macleaya cordata]